MTNNIVYSTELGRIKPSITDNKEKSIVQNDGIVRIQQQRKGRSGKGVSIITGLPLTHDELLNLMTELKKRMGCGGTIKADHIEIQGDKRDQLKHYFEGKGYKVKFSGG